MAAPGVRAARGWRRCRRASARGEGAAEGGRGEEGAREGGAREGGPGQGEAQGKTLDAGPLRALEGLLGADFSGVKVVVDDVRTAGAAPEATARPATQALSFQGAPIVMNVTDREVSSQGEGTRRVQATVSSKPDWLVLNNVYLTYNEDAELQRGEATYRINLTETNPYLRVSGSHGSDLSRLQATFDRQGNLENTLSLPPMRLRAQGLGEVEVTDVGVDLGGMRFDATLRSPQLTELVSRLPGVTLGGDTSVVIHRSGGVVDMDGRAPVEIARGERRLLEGALEFKSRGESYEGKAEVGFGETIPVLRAVKLEGTYTPEAGVSMSANLTRELAAPAGGKFELTGGLSVSYSSEAGVGFGGQVGAKLKVSEGRELSGSVGLDDELNVKGRVAGEFSPNRNLQISGAGEVTWSLPTNEVTGSGNLAARIMRHTDVDIPFEYTSAGSPQWQLSPSIEVNDVRIPGLDRPLEHNFQAPIPRMRVPLFGPLVIEGGMELALNASLGPARLDQARLEAELDVDQGFDFKRANLSGSLVCPFNAEAVLGFQLGLGLNLVIADGGAGIEARARLGMPEDEAQRSARVDINADLTQNAAGESALALNSSFNIETALALTADVNLYARYDTWFTREQLFRHNLASYNFGSWGPLGASGSMAYDENGLAFNGVEWKTPTFEAPGAEWVRQQFDAIRDWF